MDPDFSGDYEGTVTADCGIAMLDGDLAFEVAADGTMTGTVTSDIGMGDITGTVDDMGDVDAEAGVVVDTCSMVGTIDDMGDASGTFTCPVAMCTGTWEASAV